MPPLCMHSFLLCDSLFCVSRPRCSSTARGVARCTPRPVATRCACASLSPVDLPLRRLETSSVVALRCAVALPLFLSRTRCLLSACAVPRRPSPKSCAGAISPPTCIYRQSCRVEGVLKLCLREAVSRGPFGKDAAPVHFSLIWCLSERSLCRSCTLHRRLVGTHRWTSLPTWCGSVACSSPLLFFIVLASVDSIEEAPRFGGGPSGRPVSIEWSRFVGREECALLVVAPHGAPLATRLHEQIVELCLALSGCSIFVRSLFVAPVGSTTYICRATLISQ